MKKTFLLLGTAACFVFTSCDKEDNDDTNTQDTTFMNQATYINLGEIASGEIAKTKASEAVVKEFGEMMITDHTTAHNDLKTVAERINHTLPGDTDKKHKDMAALLMSLDGRAFDSTYMHMMVKGHNEAIMLHEQQLMGGDNPAVVAYAENKIRVIKHHRMMADSIARVLFPE